MKKIITLLLFSIFVFASNAQEVKKYYDNGILKESGAIINNKKNGKWKYFNENGKLIIKGKYLNGIPDGKWKYYYNNGQLKKKGTYSVDNLTPYTKDRFKAESYTTTHNYPNKSKKWKEYYKNGKLKSKGSYGKNGHEIGTWITYFNTGKINSRYTYKKNSPVFNEYIEYFENGNVKIRKESSGEIKEYYKNGNIKRSGFETTINNPTTNWKYYDENGIQINSPKKKEKVDTLLHLIKAENAISNFIFNYKKTLIQETTSYLKEKDIAINSKNTKEYNRFISKHTSQLKEQIFDNISYFYTYLTFDKLDKYINIAKTEKNSYNTLKKTKFIEQVEKTYDYHINDLDDDLELLVTNLKANNSQLKLRLIIDNDTIKDLSNYKIDLLLKTTNPKYITVDILDNEKGEIILPNDLKNDEITSLTVKYNELTIDFYETRFSEMFKDYPKELKDALDPLSTYCFKKLTHWTLTIIHNPKEDSDTKMYKEHNGIKPDVKFDFLIKFNTRVGTFTYI